MAVLFRSPRILAQAARIAARSWWLWGSSSDPMVLSS
jgi:hypothetical protein